MSATQKLFSDQVIEDVQRTWSTINSDLQQVGIEVLIRLFTKHPTYQSYFHSFKDVPLNELRERKAFQKHALAVATALNVAIDNLDNSDKLVPVLLSVGKNHVKRSITAEMFRSTQTIILETILESLKESNTKQISAAWEEVLNVAVATIIKGTQE